MQIVVPVKPFNMAKSRLTPILSAARRAQLAEALLLGVLGATAGVRGVSGIVVVSRDRPGCLDQTPCTVEWLQEQPGRGSMNSALSQASHQLYRKGVRKILILPSDLPCLKHADVQALVDAAMSMTTSLPHALIVPDKHLRGTNALAVGLPLPFPLAFGSDSLNRHQAVARQSGCHVHIMHNKSVASDLDDPQDLNWLRCLPAWSFSTPLLAALLKSRSWQQSCPLEYDRPGLLA